VEEECGMKSQLMFFKKKEPKTTFESRELLEKKQQIQSVNINPNFQS
jgi:hypothetical protein